MSPLEPPESARPALEVCPDFETLIIRLSARLLAAVPEGITAVVEVGCKAPLGAGGRTEKPESRFKRRE
jgi:hypothetical protein